MSSEGTVTEALRKEYGRVFKEVNVTGAEKTRGRMTGKRSGRGGVWD